MKPTIAPELLAVARRIRAALKPHRGAVPLTEDEQADAVLYAEGLCFACVAPVAEHEGVTWTLCATTTADGRRTVTQHFLFHSGCSQLMHIRHPHQPLREMLRAVRAGREAKA